MKKQITSTFAIIAAIIALAAATTTYAQTTSRVVVDIPFNFVAGQERMPAGRYTVSRVIRDSEKVLLIRSEDGRVSATVLTNSAQAGEEADGASLTFRQYGGDQFFLSRVWIPGTASVRSLPQSGLEKRLRRELRVKAEGQPSTDATAEAKTVTVGGSLR